MKKVLVIIVSYNFEPWIEKCLGSLRESTHPVDVLVIDNCSQDNTTQLIEQNYPEVQLIKSSENLGFGRANNIGMELAIRKGYATVFLLNQDAWIAPQTIGALLDVEEEQSRYAILSPVHLTGSGDKPEQGFTAYTGIKQLSDLPKEGSVVPVAFINAAFWMIPLAVLQAVGGFSPLFYHYGEDKDYVNRLKYHGYKLGYLPTVFGCHDREHRKVSHAAFLRSEQIYLLTEYANINYSWVQAFGYGVLASVKKALQSLIKGEVNDFGAYLMIAFLLTQKSSDVIRFRQQNRCQQANYLHV